MPREFVREEVRMEVSPALREEHQRPPARSAPPVAGDVRRRAPGRRALLRAMLSSPGAARQAFLLREVLGPPVSLRAEVADRPD